MALGTTLCDYLNIIALQSVRSIIEMNLMGISVRWTVYFSINILKPVKKNARDEPIIH